MGFSVETVSESSREMRRGVFDTLEGAKQAIYSSKTPMPVAAAVYEGDGTRGGTLVAAFDPDHGWIDVEDVSEPRWWESVPEPVREWLVEHSGEALPAWVWVPVVQAGGSAYSVQWEGGDPSGMSLTLRDEEWLRFRRASDAGRGQ